MSAFGFDFGSCRIRLFIVYLLSLVLFKLYGAQNIGMPFTHKFKILKNITNSGTNKFHTYTNKGLYALYTLMPPFIMDDYKSKKKDKGGESLLLLEVRTVYQGLLTFL